MRNLFLSFFFTIIILPIWGQNDTKVVMQTPHKDDDIIVFSNPSTNLMVSIQDGNMKYWDMKTGLLIKNDELPKNSFGNYYFEDKQDWNLLDNGCARIKMNTYYFGYKGEMAILDTLYKQGKENVLFFNDKIKFTTSKSIDSKIFIKDIHTNQVLKERSFTSNYADIPLNNDLDKYIVVKEGENRILILDSKELNTLYEIESSYDAKAWFCDNYRLLLLFDKTSKKIEVYDLTNKKANILHTLNFPFEINIDKIRVSEYLPLLFYSELYGGNWEIIDIRHNKILVKDKFELGYANGVFLPNQKNLLQFREGQLGIYDIDKKHWKAISKKQIDDFTLDKVEFVFPNHFLSRMLVPFTNKRDAYNEMIAQPIVNYSPFGYRQYFDNKDNKVYLLNPSEKRLMVFDVNKLAVDSEKYLPIDDNVSGNEFNFNGYLLQKSFLDSLVSFKLVNYNTRKVIDKFKADFSPLDNSLISKNGKYTVLNYRNSISSDTSTIIFRLRDNKKHKLVLESNKINNGIISSDETKLICFKYYEIENKNLGRVYRSPTPHQLEVYDLEKQKTITIIDCYKELKGELVIGNPYIDEDNNWLIVSTYYGYILIWDLNLNKFVMKTKVSEYSNYNFFTDKKYLYVQTNEDNFVKIFEKQTGKLLLQFILKRTKNYTNIDIFVLTNDNYYFSNKTLLNYIAFRKNNVSYTFDQFDLQYNRPDKVLESIGLAPKELIESYRLAYIKRLQNIGISEARIPLFLNGEFDKDFNAPIVELSDKQIFVYENTDKPDYKVSFKAKDTKYNLERIQVNINGVPLYGARGIEVLNRKSKAFGDTTITILLNAGENIISLRAVNEQGVASLEQRLEITYTPPQPLIKKPTLHLISIGVNQYQNRQQFLALEFAAKDAQKITELFQSQSANYEKIIPHILTDEQVTKENILSLRKDLLQSNPNDVVIFNFSGHGFLEDKSYDYYLATHNTDLNRLPQSGLKYDMVEKLLDSIPARKKLMLIDACHSGEIQKQEIRQKQVLDTLKRTEKRKFTNKDNGKTYDVTTLSQEAFELYKTTFADLRVGTGTTVISASGGLQQAGEYQTYGHAAFTYGIIKALEQKEADLDKNGEITVSELQKYLEEEVPRLTDGTQKPTSRIENIVNDFRVW
jgi:hypothetical protein